MKKSTIYTTLFISFLLGCSFQLKSQDCIQCSNCVTTGNNASAVGSSNTASGNNSLAGGYYSQSSGSNSLAFGYKSKATQSTNVALGNTAVASGNGSIAIGTYVKASAKNSFVFGAGTTASYPLTNSTPSSIAFGVNSNKPTMLITKSLNNNYTGKVAIGNVTPTAKLHIRSDSNEDAGVLIEPADKSEHIAFIKLFDDTHSITVDQTSDMELNAGSGTLKLLAPGITLTGKVGINTANKTNDYALAVDGGIISTKVYIKEVNLWPDYVFTEDYQLMDLDELKGFLNDHRHLPGMPSQDEVLSNGYDLNDMQRILVEKIEEMTRYILLLQDEINELKANSAPQKDSVIFTYDANGNRVSRSIVFKRIDNDGKNLTANQPLPYDLFPNPTSGQFTLALREYKSEEKLHAVLFTMNGVAIEEKEVHGSQTTFDLSAHPPGIYLLEVDGPDGHQSWKVIKQ